MQTSDQKYLLKLGFVYVLLFVLSVILGRIMLEFAKGQNYFIPTFETTITYVLASFVFMHIYTLTAGAWDQKIKYLLGPLCICLGIATNIAVVDIAHAIAFVLIGWIYISYYIYISNQLRKILIKFVPSMIFRSASRSFLLLFAAVAGFMVFLNYNSANSDKTLGRTIIESIPEINQTTQDSTLTTIVTRQIDDLLDPYKNFVPPIIGLIAFSVFHLLGWVSYILYNSSVDSFMWFMKKVGFLHTTEIEVKQETLHF